MGNGKLADRRFFGLYPLVAVGGLFALGVAVGEWGGEKWDVRWDLVVMAAALAVWAVAEFAVCRAAWVMMAALALGVVLAGDVLCRLDSQYGPETAVGRIAAGGENEGMRLVKLRLVVLTEPEVRPAPRDLPMFSVKASTHLLGDAASIELGGREGQWLMVAGRVAVTIHGAMDGSAGAEKLAAGQTVECAGWLMRPPGAANPGEFDYGKYLAANGVHAILSVKYPSQVRVVDRGTGGGLRSRWEALRVAARERLLRHIEVAGGRDEDVGHAMVAVLLGKRDPSMAGIGRAFAAAGVAHLLAISGFHMIIIGGAVWFMLRFVGAGLGGRPRLRAMLAAVLMLGYVALTPGGPAVLRVGVAMMLALGAVMLGRRPSGLNIWAGALLVVLLLRPADIGDGGFQLSFVTALGLIVVEPRVSEFFFGRRLMMELILAQAVGTWWARFRQRAAEHIRLVVCANMVGSAIVIPLAAFHFHQFNPLSVATGVFLLPVVGVMILTALAQLLVETVLPGGGVWLGVVTSHIAAWCVGIVEWVGNLPGACWVVRAPVWWVVAMIYVAILLWVLRQRLGWSRARAALVLAAAVTMYVGWYAATQRGGALHVWVLAVGRGSCVVVEGPGGQRVVINDGSASVSGVFDRVTEPFLRDGGIGDVEGLIATGTGGGQISGLPDVARRYRPGVLYCSEVDWTWRKQTSAVSRFFGEMERAKVAVRTLAAGDEVAMRDGVACRVLWPPKGAAGSLTAAQGEMVLELTYEGKKILLAGGRQDAALAGLDRAAGFAGTADYDGAVITSADVAAGLIEKIHAKWIIAPNAPKTAADVDAPSDTDDQEEGMAELLAAQSKGCVHVTVRRDGVKVETFK